MEKTRRSPEELRDMFLAEQSKNKYASPLTTYKKLGYTNSSTVASVLRKYNIAYLPHNKNTVAHQSYDKQVLEGNMLGDGFIYYTSKTATYPIFSVEYKHKEYCEYIQTNNPFLAGRPVKYRKRVSDRYINGFVEQHNCKSLSSGELEDQYQRWYPNGSKTIPRDLLLTPVSMLIWFLDDGYTASACNGLYLATDSFSDEDDVFLIEQLKNFNVEATQHIASSKGNHRLYIPASSAKLFLEIIGPCPVSCYQYKWK